MQHHAIAEELRARDLQFVRRIHRMRVLGVLLCMLPIASVLAERDAPGFWWLLLALNVMLWPPLAYRICRRARDPVEAQFRCLMLDSTFGGAWIAAMALSAAPTALFLAMLTADKIAAGGWSLAIRCTLAGLAGFAATWILLGFPYQPESSHRTLLLSFPFMFVYAIVLSVLTHRLMRRIFEQNRELARLNRTDPAMQLPNRPHFESIASRELARFHRYGRPTSILLVDVDHFKTINDRYGHGMGDVVLKGIAGVLRDSVRDVDLPARYGGDEFAVLLVDSDTPTALACAERMLRQVRALEFDAEPGLRCTLSIGVAELSPDYPALEHWIRAADAALYRAKAAGRDRVASA
ncbi:diguanylate cyclase [Luteimonas aestuarii]|nr:diguanylate cyclase [Luteimonas aestuarii]